MNYIDPKEEKLLDLIDTMDFSKKKKREEFKTVIKLLCRQVRAIQGLHEVVSGERDKYLLLLRILTW
jgi:hypothetical protein